MERRRIWWVVVASFVTACASGEVPDNGPSPGGALTIGSDGSGGVGETDGDTDTTFEEGTWWCTRAASARYESFQGVLGIPLGYPEGDSPEGCDCAPDETHEWLFARLAGNEVVVDEALFPSIPGDVLNLRNNIYQNAANACDDLLPDGSLSSNCNDGQVEGGAIDASGIPGFQHPGLYQGTRGGELSCSVVRTFESLPPKCDFIDGSYGVVADARGYSIPQVTFDDFFLNPGCLRVEGGRVDATPSGYEFTGIGRNTLLWELGLRAGDIPLSIDGMPLQTVEDAFTAYDALRSEKEWSLEIRRGSSSMTLEYRVQ